MKKLRCVAAAAASVLVLGMLFTGCAGSKTTGKPTTNPTPTATATPAPEVDWESGTITSADKSYTITSATTEDESGNTITKTLTKTVDLNSEQAASQMLQNGYVVEQEEVTTDADGNVTQIKQTLAIDANSLSNELKLVAAAAGLDVNDTQGDGYRRMTMTYTYQENALTNVTAAYEDGDNQYKVEYVPDDQNEGKLRVKTDDSTDGNEGDKSEQNSQLTKMLNVVAANGDVVDKISSMSTEAQTSAEEIQQTAEQYLTVSGTCGAEGENLTWKLENNGVLTISGTGEMMDPGNDTSNIPWNGYNDLIKKIVVQDGVTSLSKYAFYGCNQAVSIELPDSLTTIGAFAIADCENLTELVIPKNVTEIGQRALRGDVRLAGLTVAEGNTAYVSDENVLFTANKKTLLHYPVGLSATSYTVPSGVTCIGDSAFVYSQLEQIILPEGLEEIKDYAFVLCPKLTTLSIPSATTSIGMQILSGSEKLATLTVAEGNTTYASADNVLFRLDGTTGEKSTLLYYPIGLTATSYTVPDGVTSIESYAFANSKLTTIQLPDSLTTIGLGAFYRCTELTDINLPGKLTEIGAYAFYYCTSLKSITIPLSVKSIGYNAFGGCEGLAVTYVGLQADWNALYQGGKDKIQLTCLGNIGIIASGNCGKTEEENVAGTNLSWALDSQGTLTISGTGEMMDVDSQGAPWQAYCSSIKKIVVQDGVTSIGSYAFCGCAQTSVELPNSLTKIGYRAFWSCRNLTEITIPASVTEIENNENIFMGDTKLAKITVAQGNTAYMAENNVLFTTGDTTDEKILICYPQGLTATSYTVPDDVDWIGTCAFASCTRLTEITLPQDLFMIQMSAFQGCTGLTAIVIPDKTRYINMYAFRNCTKLATITIPVSMQSIESNAFSGCNNLTVTYKGFKADWDELYEGETDTLNVTCLEQVGTVASGLCSANAAGTTLTWTLDNTGKLTLSGTGALTQPEYAGNWSWNLYSSQIKNIVIEEGVTSISAYSFKQCTNLESVTIPRSMETLETAVFSGCPAVTYRGSEAEWKNVTRNSSELDNAVMTYLNET